VADASFNALDQMRYSPFGVGRDAGASLNTDRLFTAQTDVQVIGLYWYGARAYDAALGRFCAPDNIVPSLANPQALNRYSYVLNNPLRLVDPTQQI
jgi:RHS repeat-associated protein